MNDACFKTKNLGRDEIFISSLKQLLTTFGNYALTKLALNGPFRNIEHGRSLGDQPSGLVTVPRSSEKRFVMDMPSPAD